MNKLESSGQNRLKRGDTIIEVIFAVAVFAVVSVAAMMIMNKGLDKTTGSLELTLAREEMAAQGEAVRYIHENHVAELSLQAGNRPYQALWNELARIGNGNSPTSFRGNQTLFRNLTTTDAAGNQICAVPTEATYGYFITNTRSITTQRVADTVITRPEAFNTRAGTYARLVFQDATGGAENPDTNDFDAMSFTNVRRTEGIWAVPIHSTSQKPNHRPSFYDVYIVSCWLSPGETVPSTLGTLVRMYNPD